MLKILELNTDLQQVNRVHKTSINQVEQITCASLDSPIPVQGADYAIYNYNGFYECLTAHYKKADTNNPTIQSIQLHIECNDHSAEATEGVLYKKGNLTIRQKSNFNNIEVEVNSSVIIDYAYTHSTELYLLVVIDSSNIYLANNGIIVAVNSYTGYVDNNEIELFSDGTNYFKGNVYSIKRWDNDILSVIGSSINDVVGKFNPDFHYHKRYREDGNKKLFISSRYLKDAVVDVDDNITSIKNEITDSIFVSVGTLLDNGFRSDNTLNVTYLNLGPYTGIVGDKDLMFGCWFKHNDTVLYDHYYPVKNSVFNIDIIDYGTSSSRIYVMFKGESFLHNRDFGHNWGYISIAYDFSENKLYLLLNGKIIDIFTTTIGTALFNNIQFHTTSTTLTDYNGDDFLFIENVLPISIVGKSVGDKVFNPPRRRSSESEFIQF